MDLASPVAVWGGGAERAPAALHLLQGSRLSLWLRKLCTGLLLLVGVAFAWDADRTAQMMSWAQSTYGVPAAERVQRWQQLYKSIAGSSEMEKLTSVNRFFNAVPSVTDQAHWGKPDYWATPLELLASNGGDCEDFAIAKYFTLRELGVPEERLKIAYVKARLGNNQQSIAHMVLTYYATPEAEPLVLDNLNGSIKPAQERPDLTPLYSFNARGLWAAKERTLGKWLGPSDDIDLWKDLIKRMEQLPKQK
jgi:predicted transglutaminase-like cysteine proteinase